MNSETKSSASKTTPPSLSSSLATNQTSKKTAPYPAPKPFKSLNRGITHHTTKRQRDRDAMWMKHLCISAGRLSTKITQRYRSERWKNWIGSTGRGRRGNTGQKMGEGVGEEDVVTSYSRLPKVKAACCKYSTGRTFTI